MATVCLLAHCRGHEALPHAADAFSCSASSSSKSQLWSCSTSAPIKPPALPSLRTSTSSIAGTSSYLLLPPSTAPQRSRGRRRSQSGMAGVIKAAFIFQVIRNIILSPKKPMKLLAQKVEDDLDLTSKMIKKVSSIVIQFARGANEFADRVERIALRAEEIAEKVAAAAERIEQRIDEVLDVIEGEKELVVTSFTLADNKDIIDVSSTAIAQDGNESILAIETTETSSGNESILAIETSSVSDSNLGNTISP